MRGYYSLVQFSPDAARAEAANVGVVLLCPEVRFVGCKIAGGNDRPRRFFKIRGEILDRLDEMKQALATRIEVNRNRIYKLEDFERFIHTRANQLLLTPPRNLKVAEPEDDLSRLFRQMVGGRATGDRILKRGQGVSVRARLRALFAAPSLRDKVEEDVRAELKYGRPFTADYAFYNGKVGFVVPQTIHVDPDQTLGEAERLAIRGSQLAKYGVRDRPAELIVPLPNPDDRLRETTYRVDALLRDYGVRPFFARDLDHLAEEIRERAHVID